MDWYCIFAEDRPIAAADKAGVDEAGADEAGADKAGADKAGADEAGVTEVTEAMETTAMMTTTKPMEGEGERVERCEGEYQIQWYGIVVIIF